MRQPVGQRIRWVREQLGLSQEAFAARLGMARVDENKWENGRHAPGPSSREKLAALTGLEPAFFEDRRRPVQRQDSEADEQAA